MTSQVTLGTGNYADYVAITNTGGVVTSSIFAVEINAGCGLTNAGTISDPDYGVSIVQGSLINSGSIFGGGIGVSADFAYIKNTGHITGATNFDSNGMRLDGGSLNNLGYIFGTSDGIMEGGNESITNSGTIIGVTDGIVLNNDGIQNTSETLTNLKNIYGHVGVEVVSGGIVYNSGSIGGRFAGLGLESGDTLINSGTVHGSEYYGVIIGQEDSLLNSGYIYGVDKGLYDVGGGTIRVSATNSGTIAGGTYAVYAYGPLNLTLNPGADFIGKVKDHSGTGEIVLAGSTSGMLAMGNSFSGFDGLTFAPGASWLVAGTEAVFAGETISGFPSSDLIVLDGFAATSDTFIAGTGLILSNGSATETLDITGNFTESSTYGLQAFSNGINTTIGLAQTFTLTTGRDTLTGGSGNNLFIATKHTLNQGDTVNGGSGTNVLEIIGGGTVTMGGKISGMQYAAIDDAGVSGTKFIANTTANLAILAGSGNDTIVLGAKTQRVIAGSGTLLVKGKIGDAGVSITSTGTNTTFELTTGGTGTLNVADTDLIVTLNTATNLTLSQMGFIHAIGSSGKDKITALAANQTLTGGLGLDTLVGYTGFGDVFLDNAAGLNGDTIKYFGGSDVIDITDINSTLVTSFGYSGNSTSGILTISDGANSAAIKMIGNYSLSSFGYTTDNSGGTLIKFV